MQYLLALVGLFCSIVIPLSASAATLQALGGDVFIDRGRGYTTVSGATSAKAGDIVMVKAGGSGEIIYDDGCRQTVEVGSVVVVGEVSPCAAGLSESAIDNVYLYTGLGIAAVIGGVVALSNDDDDKCVTKCKK